MTDPGDRKARQREEWDGRTPQRLFDALKAQPVIGDALCAHGAVLMDEVDHRTRELVALRVSAVRECAYVWSGHVLIAQKLALTPREIQRVAIGPMAYTGRDAAVLWAADHVLARRPIDPVTERVLGKADVLSICVSTMFYDTVASIMRDADPEPGPGPVEGLATPAEARGAYAAMLA